MKIYHYDYDGFFLSEGNARQDPLSNDFLIPAYATKIQLPDYDSKTHFCKFDNKKWAIFKKIEPTISEHLKKETEIVFDGNKFVEIEMTSVRKQEKAIDAHISQVIKEAVIIGEPANYDSVGEIGVYVHSINNDYRIEAQTLIVFVEKCHEIQSKIKNGAIAFDSVDDAIAALPKI